MSSDLRTCLLEIRRQHGTLTPDIIVNEARDEKHQLHTRFEWDDAVAGESWRREQASELVRSVKITFGPERDRKEIRAFHSIRREAGNSYEPVEEILDDEMTRRILLRDMERDWRSFKRRYEHLEEFWALLHRDAA